MSQTVTAFAPASIGNLGVGFDMLGLALADVGDRVSARRIDAAEITVAEVRGLEGEIHPYLSTDPLHNTASIAAQAMWDDLDEPGGVELKVFKGIPLQSGMGSSAASAVAAVVAVNGLLDKPLVMSALMPYALEGEKYASGGLHTDNVAPCLLGGMILCPPELMPDTIRLSVPQGVSAVLLHPELQINTAASRQGLAKRYSMEQWLSQQGYLAGFIAACAANDIDMIRRTLKDVVIEPQRSAAVPCFDQVKATAIHAGALGCSLSGSGPSIFALTRDGDARNIASAMEQSCRSMGIDCQSWIGPMNAPGAMVEAD
jgi:homoserine kinase